MQRRIFGIIIAVTGLLVFYYLVHSTSREADFLLINGIVYTLDDAGSVAQSIAIRGNVIVATGPTEKLQKEYEADSVIDLRGSTVIPGLIDAHGHVAAYGELHQSLVLAGIRSSEEILQMVEEKARQLPPGEWIFGRGWDQNLWEDKRFPTAEMLDRVSPANPVVLVRIDGHAIWVNSRAMESAGVTRAATDPPGGKIVRDADGNLLGIFMEDTGRELIESAMPPPSDQEIRRRILTALYECATAGLTEVADMGIDTTELRIYKELEADGKLPIRVYAAISIPTPGWQEQLTQAPIVDDEDGMFTLRAVKMYTDGALGSRGAALVESYSDDPGNRGVTTTTEEDLELQVNAAVAAGYQPCIHAIGDRGNHIALKTFERTLKSTPSARVRPRIEHAQVLLKEDIAKFHSLGVIPSMQPVHATSDMYWAEARLGSKRIEGAYAWHSLIATGSIIASGSDFPNDAMYPLWGFYAAVTRSDRNGYPQDGWRPAEKMTREEALRSFTTWAAYASFEEDRKGTIESGKWADLTVISDDIMSIPPQDILKASIKMTMVGGQIVYQRPDSVVAQ